MRFTKMHGLGNDYVFINGFEETIDDPAALAPQIADRHFGVGGDGLILLLPPKTDKADVRMRIFNADGSEAEMCGNGIRCLCKLAHDRGVTNANPMRMETGAGVLSLQYTLDDHRRVDQVTVDMGQPILEPAEVPVDPGQLQATDQPQTFIAELDDGRAFTFTAVSMGNPHAVIYTSDLTTVDLQHIGPALEHHPAFSARMNVHFVRLNGPAEVTVRTWERGSGPTLACGTGACAICVAGVLTGRTNRRLTTHLPGGPLTLHWADDEHVHMTGPATEVFTGQYRE